MFRAAADAPSVLPQDLLVPLARRLLLTASALPPALFGVGRGASAHALVVTSEPAAGAALEGAPARVWLRFNSRIDRERSRLTLHGPDNGQTPLPLDAAAEPTLLAARTDIVPWAAGAWRLRWQVLALDGHITRGDVPFTLRPR